MSHKKKAHPYHSVHEVLESKIQSAKKILSDSNSISPSRDLPSYWANGAHACTIIDTQGASARKAYHTLSKVRDDQESTGSRDMVYPSNKSGFSYELKYFKPAASEIHS